MDADFPTLVILQTLINGHTVTFAVHLLPDLLAFTVTFYHTISHVRSALEKMFCYVLSAPGVCTQI